jgi:Ca2+-binding RTX toxin-like protein
MRRLSKWWKKVCGTEFSPSLRRQARPGIEQLEAREVPALISQGSAIEVKWNGYTRGDGVVAQADDGRFVTAWIDQWSTDVYARVYQEDGTPLTGSIRVGKTTPHWEDNPTVAMNGSGEFVVAWTHPYSDTDYDVYAQRFTAEGAPVGGISYVATSSQTERTPSVAIDAAGNFVVAYEYRSGDTRDVRAARFDSQGGWLGSSTIAGSDRPEFAPSVAMSPAGNFVVAYTYEYLSMFGSRDLDVHARRFAADGTPQGDSFGVAGMFSDDEFQPAVGMNAEGDFVVAYTAARSETSLSAGLSLRTSGDVEAVAYNADGTRQWLYGASTVANGAANEWYPAVAVSANGGYVVAYNSGGDWRPGVITQDVETVRMRQFTPDGQPQPGAVPITLTPPTPWYEANYSPAVSISPSGDVVAVYNHISPVPGGLPTTRVFAQRFHTHGYRVELGWPDGVQEVKLTNGQSFSLPVTIYRDHGYTGDVSLSGLFFLNGVSVTFSAPDPSRPQVETRTVTFSAALNLQTDGPAQGTILANSTSPFVHDIAIPVDFHLTAGRVTHVSTFGAPAGTLTKGSSATIYGAGFLPGSVVEFGGGARATPSYLNAEGTFISVTVPTNAQSGPVTVVTPTGARLVSPQSYTIEAGRITSLSTLSGDAPQELREGTSVTIHGYGFTPGARVQFGDPSNLRGDVQATAYFVNHDGTELSVRVPRLAVDGPLTVVTPNGNITSAESFTVRNYRNTHGFQFHNPSFNISFPMVRDVFGADQTNIKLTIPNPIPFLDDIEILTPIPAPHALAFTAILAGIFNGEGGCFGMAYTSEHLQRHPGEINGHYGLPAGAAPTVFNLVPNGNLVAQIQRNHLLQASAEVINYWLGWQTSHHDAANTRDMLRDLLGRGENPLVSIRDDSGHVVTAYDVEDVPGGYDILVYDSNIEYLPTPERTSAGGHLTRENASRIRVRGNEWDYMMGATNWHGGFGTLMVLPYGNVPTDPTIPTSLSGLATMLFGSLGNAPRLSVSDAGGLTVNGFLFEEGAANDIDIGTTEAGEVEVTLNGETTRFAPGEITAVEFYGGANADTIDVARTLAGVPVTIYVGGGDVTVNVASLGALAADLTVVGGTGREVLNVIDRDATDSHSYLMRASSIGRDGAGTVRFEAIDEVNLFGGSGWDVYHIHSTAAGTTTTVHGGDGGDQYAVNDDASTLDGIQGPLHLRGEGGGPANYVSMSDYWNTAGQAYTLRADSLSRTGMADVTFDDMGQFILYTGRGADTVDVESVAPGVFTPIAVGTGDTLTLGRPVAGGRTLDEIRGTVRPQSGPGETPLVVLDDSAGDAGAARRVVFDVDADQYGTQWAHVTGLAPAAIDLMLGAGSSVQVRGSGANETFSLPRLLAGVGIALDGGTGRDALDYSAWSAGVTVNLAAGTATGLAGVQGIENVTGGAGDDRLTGDAGNNLLRGGGGDDVIRGGAGKDTLLGEGGRDLLIGGLGNDRLDGGADEDIVIGGTTSHDADDAALVLLMEEWKRRDRTYAQRVSALRTGAKLLIASKVQDAGKDTLTGGAALDWYFANGTDTLSGRTGSERLN